MDLIVYLNNNFIKSSEAKVSIYDHGFLYGDGAFETLKAYNGHIFRFEDHIERLHGSLKQIKMDLPISASVILKAIKLLLQHNQLRDAYIRITVSRGEGPIGIDRSLCPDPTLLVVAEPVRGCPARWYSEGISVIISRYRKIPDICIPSGIKSSNYLAHILARSEVHEKAAQDGILLNIEGYVAEGITSNIFIVKDKKLLTPALSSGILNGITRKTVIELAEKRSIEVIERHILPKEIFTADECFLTNTSMEIMPVAYCDGTGIGNASCGKITQLLMKDFRKMVDRLVEEEKKAAKV